MLRGQFLLLSLCGLSCTAPQEQGSRALPDAGVRLLPDASPRSAGALDAGLRPPRGAAVPGGDTADAARAPRSDCIANSFPITYVSTGGTLPFIEHELFVMSADGLAAHIIARGGHFQNPTWAPDGNSIAFRHRTPWADEVTSYVGLIRADGSQTLVLTDEDTYPYVADPVVSPDGPSWSPDGQNIAYVSQRESSMWRIWIMSRSGGQPRLLLPDLAQPQLYVSWAPHAANVLAYVESSDTGSDIWRVDLTDTSLRENLSRGRVSEPTSVRWSPDGTRIAFAALDTRGADAGGGDSEIFVLDVANGDISQFTDDEFLDLHPTWSPDGQRLLYSSGRPWSGLGVNHDFWLLTLDGSEPPRQVTTRTRQYSPDWYAGSCATSG